MNNSTIETSDSISEAFKIDQVAVKSHVSELVRASVEETLNGLLDAEADQLCGAQRYERSADRSDGRAGHYTRKLQTQAGEVELKVPKLRKGTFETQIIERYKRRETSVEEALVEMYLAGVSVRRVEDITEALWGTRVTSSTVSELNQKIYERIEEWRTKPIEGEHPYIFLDGIWLKRSWGGEVKNVAVLIAIGVNDQGFREVLGVSEGAKEDKDSWVEFLRHLKERGLKGVQLVTSDCCLGLVESIAEFYPNALWQRCLVHWYRNLSKRVPKRKVYNVMAMAKALHAQESLEAAREKALYIIDSLKQMKLSDASEFVRDTLEDIMTYHYFPREHQRRIRSNNGLERVNKEVRRRTRVVGAFPDGKSALMLVSARLRYVASKEWGTKKYLNMDHLRELLLERKHQEECNEKESLENGTGFHFSIFEGSKTENPEVDQINHQESILNN
jgi:transposase-like protein